MAYFSALPTSPLHSHSLNLFLLSQTPFPRSLVFISIFKTIFDSFDVIFSDNFTPAYILTSLLRSSAPSHSLNPSSSPFLSIQKCVVFPVQNVHVSVHYSLCVWEVCSYLSMTSCSLSSQGSLSWRDKQQLFMFYIQEHVVKLISFLSTAAVVNVLNLCDFFAVAYLHIQQYTEHLESLSGHLMNVSPLFTLLLALYFLREISGSLFDKCSTMSARTVSVCCLLLGR